MHPSLNRRALPRVGEYVFEDDVRLLIRRCGVDKWTPLYLMPTSVKPAATPAPCSSASDSPLSLETAFGTAEHFSPMGHPLVIP